MFRGRRRHRRCAVGTQKKPPAGLADGFRLPGLMPGVVSYLLLAAFRIAARQAGHATIHHHYRRGTALWTELCANRVFVFRKRILLLALRFEFRSFLCNQFQLPFVQFGP